MSRGIILFAFISSFLLLCCEGGKNKEEEVEIYIQQLLKGEYRTPDLPEFIPEDIPDLLAYRDDTSTIISFPHNPISSLYLEECRLGLFVLWTIESIRAVEIQSEFLIRRFPSQNPYIYYANPDLMMPYDPNIAQSIAAKAYFDWWNSDTNLSEKFEIDPLENTGYKWH